MLSGALDLGPVAADIGSALPRPLIPLLFACAIGAGLVLLFIGYAIGVHGGICDPYNCPSETTRATGRVLLPVGATMAVVGVAGLIAWLLRDQRRRARNRPAPHKPTPREW